MVELTLQPPRTTAYQSDQSQASDLVGQMVSANFPIHEFRRSAAETAGHSLSGVYSLQALCHFIANCRPGEPHTRDNTIFDVRLILMPIQWESNIE